MELTNSRLHHSLPTLNLPSCPEYRSRAPQRRRRKRNGADAFGHILSAFYAKLLVILGFALPITDAIATDDFDSYDGFYMYLYVGSIVFLLYMYFVQMREKSYESWRHSLGVDNRQSTYSTDSGSGAFKKHHYIRYGSFYFRMGVTGFGIGSVIYAGLEFGQYFELSSEGDCNNIMKAVKPMCKIIFSLVQMLFIFSYSNFVDVQRTKAIARFGLMHMIATNLCEWLFVLIQETQHDIYASAIRFNDRSNFSAVDMQFLNSKSFKVTESYYKHKYACLKSKIMEPILGKLVPYLAPCTVEYSLLCAVILGLMWKNTCSPSEIEFQRENSAEVTERQSGCNVIYSKRQSQFSVDCAQAHKGLFIGILVLAVTIISLIMFFELVAMKDYKDAAVLQVNIWEAVLFWAGTIAVICCLHSLRDVRLHKMKGMELEHILLLVTQCGLFMYFLFQIIGGIFMGIKKGKGGMMRIMTPVSALIQSSAQTVLVLNAWGRRCTTQLEMIRKPGRQLITFLLVVNISLWINNRLKNNQSLYHPNQMDFYGILAWNIITHVSMPLVLSYRFQSTVCFYQIWKHVYKMSPINKDHNDVKHDLNL